MRKHSTGSMYDISLAFANSADKELELKPTDLRLQIISMNDDTMGELINSVDIAVGKVKVPSGGYLRYVLPTWDGKDASGVAVSPGIYKLVLSGPEKIEYTKDKDIWPNDQWNNFGDPVIVVD